MEPSLPETTSTRHESAISKAQKHVLKQNMHVFLQIPSYKGVNTCFSLLIILGVPTQNAQLFTYMYNQSNKYARF